MTQASIKILLFGLDTGQSNDLVKQFRLAGYVIRSQIVETELDLKRSLEQGADLFLGSADADKDTFKGIANTLAEHSEQLPIILLGDMPKLEPDVSKRPAYLYIPADSPALIVQCAVQEYLALLTRRELTLVKRKLAESEQRSELLFQQSEAALAYVVDGILVSSNKAFLRFFGEDHEDKLITTPIVDLFAAEDRANLKKLLKAGSGAKEAELHPVSPNHNGLPLSAQAADAVCNDEPCRQLTLNVPSSGFDDGDEMVEILPVDSDAPASNDETTSTSSQPITEAPAIEGDSIRFQALLSLKGLEGELYELSIENQANLIDQADDCGSVDFDHNLIMAACKSLSEQRRASGSDQRLVVPVSRNVLFDPDFCSWLCVALKAGDLPANAIYLSLSYQQLTLNAEQAKPFAEALQDIDTGLAIHNIQETDLLDAEDNSLFDHFHPKLISTSDDFDIKAIRSLIQRANNENCRVVLGGINSMSDMASAFRYSPDYLKGSHIHEPDVKMDYDFSSASA